jgi:hypothetical protein
LQIHQRDVWAQRSIKLDRLEAVAGFAYDLNIGHDVEQSDKTLPDDMMVIDYKDANAFSHCLLHLFL